MLEAIRDNVSTLAIIAASLTTLAAFLGLVIKKVVLPTWRRAHVFFDDVQEGIEKIKVLDRVAIRELTPNGGNSMKDVVHRMENTLNNHINDMIVHRDRTEPEEERQTDHDHSEVN